jgi:parallel beta-helix repeat protein
VVANEIADMGAGGVKIGETQQRPNEADRNFEHTVTDNQIHDLGAVYPSAIGVWVGQSSRNTVSHNHIHDLYYTAISVGWTWGYGPNQCNGNAIEFNHLHHIGKGMLSDMGAIYTLGMQPGTTIRNNVIHDVWSFTYGGWGIYPDEGSANEVIENNIVYRTKSAGFHQHYGRENIVRNNIFAFGSEFQLMRTRAEPHLSFTFEGNIVYFDSGALLGSNWSGEGVRMDKNVYWDARGPIASFSGRTLAEWRGQGRDVASAVADPLFRNAASYDFTVLPESPVWKMGWKRIDASAVGPRRAAGPAVQVAP